MIYAPQLAPHHNPIIQAIFEDAIRNAKADMAMLMLMDYRPLEEVQKYTSLTIAEIKNKMKRYFYKSRQYRFDPITQEMLDITAKHAIREIAGVMLKDGIPEDKVARYSSIPIEEVKWMNAFINP